MTIGFICFDDRLVTMAQRLIKTGYKLRVFSCTEDEKLEMEGMEVVKTPAETVEPEGIVITLVPDDGKLKEVTFGPEGIGEALKEKGIQLSLSSVLPETSREIANCHRKAGAFYVSAPSVNILRGSYGGRTLFFLSGPQEAKERITPLLQKLDGEILDTGTDEGAASAMKLTAGFLIASLTESLAEGFMFAERQGLQPRNVFKLLGEKLFACPVYNIYGERLSENDYPDGYMNIDTAYKDIKLIAGMSHKSSVTMPFLNVIHNRLLSSVKKGRDFMDISSIGLEVLEDTPYIEVSHELTGRILDGFGRLIDRKSAPGHTVSYSIYSKPLKKMTVTKPFYTGIRALDGLFTIGRGQTIGLITPNTVEWIETTAKIAKDSACDVNVLVFVGSRGRDVKNFIEVGLQDEGLSRSVIIATGINRPYTEKLRSIRTGMAVAEYFRDQGKDVLLIVDNINQFTRAKAEEASHYSRRAGSKWDYASFGLKDLQEIIMKGGIFSTGSITAFYVYFTDGGELSDIGGDYIYNSLDARLSLSKRVYMEGWYPPIDVKESINPMSVKLINEKHHLASEAFKEAWKLYQEHQEAVSRGFYRPGENSKADWAVENFEKMKNFINQKWRYKNPFKETVESLIELMASPYSGGDSPWQ